MLVGCLLHKSSCSTRRHAFLFNKRTCLLVEEEDMSSCSTIRHVFLFNKRKCLCVEQEDMSLFSTATHVFFLLNKKTCSLVQQEDKKACLLVDKNTCLLAHMRPHMDTDWVVLKINCLGVSLWGQYIYIYICNIHK